jgi:hypothetical protein
MSNKVQNKQRFSHELTLSEVPPLSAYEQEPALNGYVIVDEFEALTIQEKKSKQEEK